MKADDKDDFEKCVWEAGCESNFMAMSEEKKKALAKEYHTSVETLAKAYKKLGD